MEWLDRLVHTFIMTFGITQPSAANRRIANLVIGGLLLLMVFGLLGIVFAGIRSLAR